MHRRLHINTIDHALRLLNTEEACLGTGLAAVVVAVAVLIVFSRALEGRIRLMAGVLIISSGLVVGTGIVQVTYHAWYTHRCVHHSSDIRECDARS
jgi:protein-S-isoprenylcysteine O-methyltransferase Ste14